MAPKFNERDIAEREYMNYSRSLSHVVMTGELQRKQEREVGGHREVR